MISYEGWDREYLHNRDKYIEVFDSVMKGNNWENPHEFEAWLSRDLARKHTVAVANATDALYLTLKSWNIGEGDEVLVTAFSWVSSVSCVFRCGATPVFCDIDVSSYHMSLASMERMLSHRTRAVVYPHLFGNMVDMAPIVAFCKTHNLLLLEDAAQSWGSEFGGAKAGTFGDASVFSFNTNKVVAGVNGGGAVVTDDDVTADRVRKLSKHGKQGDDFETLGVNSRMYVLNSRIIQFRISNSKQWQLKRQAIAQIYNQAFAGLPVATQSCNSKLNHSFHKYVVRFQTSQVRDAVQLSLNACVHYARPLHLNAMNQTLPHKKDNCANAESVASTVLSLPIHPWLTEEEISHVIRTVVKHFV